MKANVRPPGLDADNSTRCRSRRTRTTDQILPSHQGERHTGLDYAPNTQPRGVYPGLAGAPPTYCCNTSHHHPPSPAPTGSAPRKPTQTEILTENVKNLTEVVRALVDREAHNVQLPLAQQEAAKSTPSKPPRSASRPRNPSPTGDRSGRSNRESLEWQQRDKNEDLGRVRSRSRHTQATRSGAADPLAATRDHPDNNRGEAENVQRNTTSVFDRLGRPGIYRRLGREHSVDKSAIEENHDRRRLDHLQRQLDQLVGQQYVMEQVGTINPPFTSAIMASPYPARFKMPSVTSYDDSTDADEHLENYQAHMLIQNTNEAALCKSFCLTLTGVARQWYRRLVPGSIGYFKQLADSFAAAFLGSKIRKLRASYLFGIKQGEAEILKKCLKRFDKAVV
ncbi:hypothetical protein TIFTF001_032942 [Ficus carica]|uniref:Retrotransposon gag domain-containing protein n=1 Tax=Ficus carica TaxID=3494 RepID=A0AA88DXA7_FICCA|nr:hypothetical protein TIFTF001_032942 [Ficus carica]